MVFTNKEHSIINKFPEKNLLVLGDILVDKYIMGEATRVSPEAPVIVVHVNKERYIPGGAANVANNISSLGAKVSLCGVVGSDIVGKRFLHDLKNLNINPNKIITDRTRNTIVKTRVLASHQQLVRFDYEDKKAISEETEKRILSSVRKDISNFDAIVVSDYEKGFVTPNLIQNLIALSKKTNKLLICGPKPNSIKFYEGSDVISLNRSEALKASELLGYSSQSIDQIGTFLIKKLKLKAALITLSEKGMMLVQSNKKVQIPACAKEVFDVTGAGDTVLATFSLAVAAGADFETAARLANKAAGIVVGKLGTATVKLEELLDS